MDGGKVVRYFRKSDIPIRACEHERARATVLSGPPRDRRPPIYSPSRNVFLGRGKKEEYKTKKGGRPRVACVREREREGRGNRGARCCEPGALTSFHGEPDVGVRLPALSRCAFLRMLRFSVRGIRARARASHRCRHGARCLLSFRVFKCRPKYKSQRVVTSHWIVEGGCLVSRAHTSSHFSFPSCS